MYVCIDGSKVQEHTITDNVLQCCLWGVAYGGLGNYLAIGFYSPVEDVSLTEIKTVGRNALSDF